jgi:DNA-binding transcriptional regulator YdaS (Cro superfamily)
MLTPEEDAIEKAGGPQAVAKLLGKSVQAVCFWRDGKRRFPVELIPLLEKASGVRRWAFRPDDWHQIWPELQGAEGAPPIKDATAEVKDAA